MSKANKFSISFHKVPNLPSETLLMRSPIEVTLKLKLFVLKLSVSIRLKSAKLAKMLED